MYFKRQAEGLTMQNEAAEIKMRAERKLGLLLSERDMHKGGGNGSNQSHDGTGCPSTLADIGITKMQSHRWQQISVIPDDIFHTFIENTKQDGEELTTKSLLELHQTMALLSKYSF